MKCISRWEGGWLVLLPQTKDNYYPCMSNHMCAPDTVQWVWDHAQYSQGLPLLLLLLGVCILSHKSQQFEEHWFSLEKWKFKVTKNISNYMNGVWKVLKVGGVCQWAPSPLDRKPCLQCLLYPTLQILLICVYHCQPSKAKFLRNKWITNKILSSHSALVRGTRIHTSVKEKYTRNAHINPNT